MHKPQIHSGLYSLREAFRQNGFDIKLVGGCVRDFLLGIESHDIDLCTDANPDEQGSIYRHYGFRHIDTGLQHGTYTVVKDNVTYEITSLRTETDCDGRHATVSYTRDWLLDLSRRDLTFNAMLMDFEGNLTDPYDGHTDLKNRVVRFVGNADERMVEDYLRILRWYRFHARMGKGHFDISDVLTTEAVMRNMHGLAQISRERVWSEFRRILADPHGLTAILEIIRIGVYQYIDLPVPMYNNAISFNKLEMARKYTADPVSLMAAYLNSPEAVRDMARKWRWSTDDLQQAVEVVTFMNAVHEDVLTDAKRQVALHNVKSFWVAEALRVMGHAEYAHHLMTWNVPVFPVTGQDLLNNGMKAGPEMGNLMKNLRKRWADLDYSLTSNDLLTLANLA
jgi:tRNA nucleotidyltransferase (CCA-adding enzyme)